MNDKRIAKMLKERAWHKLKWDEEITEGVGKGIPHTRSLSNLCMASGRLKGTLSADHKTLQVEGHTLPVELTARAQAHLADFQEGEQEVIVTVWPTWDGALSQGPTLHDFEVKSLRLNCINLLNEDAPQPSSPHVLVGGLVQARHEHGFEIALSSRRAKTSPVYVRALGKLHTKTGHPFCGLIKLVHLGEAHVWMLEREFQVDWKPFKRKKPRPRKQATPQSKPPAPS
jgi:hypothetical protein